MIITGGENVYPAEVESVLTGHPAVAEVAVVVLRPGAQVSEAELIVWTRDRLAHFKCPAGVSFAASLARTASGKLQKQAIRASLSSVAVP
jgi:acyl-CoA synthetase (AMP-forming)/AMP-acid ligase II